MSTSDPLLPSSGDPEQSTVAAEPGSGGPQPQSSEEPDLAIGDETDRSLDDAVADEKPPFRPPTPGDKLSPGDLQAE
ncbi:hypothetical protein E4P42_08235 [Mycobacterium sp. PS03-16]|uniref:hypothetical protein n=1 Tax=Mycobacterium sp. PS03-16 TaxID=2559611 RepID=UPI001073CAF1|nr:hypothetical protein [Mycobacterium sp. PS03-16]TFV59395.1 hypothetical protein E4P42_08235 [Mycobacterium sp. PS03-16]